ncbi:MAG: OsmC family protein [Thermoplasmata archaeon]|nr:OsmC family protein [Thermoplasmata archaeon]
MAFEVTGTADSGFVTRLQDDRGHGIVVDLPADEGGTDAGTSALELTLISLAGCIGTIFRRVAERRRFAVEGFSIRLNAERGDGAPTIERVEGTFTVRSPADDVELETALRLTLRICPVGVLFDRAGVPVTVRLVRAAPPAASDRIASVPGASSGSAVPDSDRAVPLDRTT